MKTNILLVLLFALLFSSCKKSENPASPATETTTEDFSFPQSSRFAFVVYSDNATVKNGDLFDVKVILYNATDVFGTATEISYPNDKVSVQSAVTGPYFSPLNDALTLSKIEADSGRVSYGITYKAGVTKLSSGSGILYKLKCKATKTGTASFILNAQNLQILKSDGSAISNFSQIVKENLTITIQ